MYKILIIEDEAIIRNGLKKVIDWGSLSCEIAGEASDGLSGIEAIERLCPDIVLCDIKMPNGDGFYVASYVQSRKKDLKLIFLTGYDDFSCAQQAIKLEAADYILKPASKQTLTNAIVKALSDLENYRKFAYEYARVKEYMDYNLPVIRENFLRQCILYGESYKLLTDRDKLLADLSFFGIGEGPYILGIFELSGIDSHCLFDIQFAKYLLRDKIESEESLLCYFCDYDRNTFLILFSSIEKTVLHPALQKSISELEVETKACTTVGLSCEFQEFSQIHHAFKEARSALMNQFFCGVGSLNVYIPMNEKKSEFTVDYNEIADRIIDFLKEGSFDMASAEIKKFTSELKSFYKECSEKIQFIKNDFIDLFVLLARKLELLGLSIPKIIPEENHYLQIMEATEISELESLLVRSMNKIYDSMMYRRRNHYHSIMKKLYDYLYEHYREEVTLNHVARILYMNPSYTSRIIKKVTGKNFIDILMGIRIEKAKELMLSTNTKSYEIAESVGFNDAKYFSQVFKKQTGMTFSEYKNLQAYEGETSRQSAT